MKRHIAFMAFFASVACLAAPTANEDFVLAEDAQTFTNAVNAAKEYADGKIAALPVIGDYANVSNRAVNAAPMFKDSELISCAWAVAQPSVKLQQTTEMDGRIVWTWAGVHLVRQLTYDGKWLYRYFRTMSPIPDWQYTNTSSRAATELIFSDDIILTRCDEVWGGGTNNPVAYMDDLSRAADDATNYTDWVVQNLDIPDPDLSAYAKKTEVQGVALQAATNTVAPVVAIVDSWEGYWSGSNVVFEVTNYYGNTTGAKPRLRIREYRDEQWRTVWDEENKFAAAETNIVKAVVATNSVLYAPIAWGTVTDKGSPNPVTNTTFMTSPETYFAGGTEYQRVAVGSGTICVLVDRGALARTAGQPGTFRFQDDGGTNFFGFAKSDSYTIGCRTDGITVDGGLVTLRYDVIMAGTDVPVVYWRENLHEGSWTQLNNVDGTVADGAPYAVTWYTSGGSYYAAINCTGNASGFFRAETSVMGDVVWETNMRARLGGGLECTNTATHVNGVIRPSYNGSSVTWTWSAR